MKATVVICTYDRSRFLSEALQSLRGQAPGLPWEVLVVDNHPLATARDVVGRWKGIRYAHDPEPGLSRARNRGLREAHGEVVAYLDDDAAAEPGWLEELLAPYFDPRVASVGGRIRLQVEGEGPVPAWYTPYLHRELGEFHLGGDLPSVLTELDVSPAGGNISFRRSALLQQGESPFRQELGRVGDQQLAGEELLLCKELRERGWTVVYNPRAVVRHRVGPERLRRSFLRRRFRANALTGYLLSTAGIGGGMHRVAERYVRSIVVDLLRLLRQGRDPGLRQYLLFRLEGHLYGLFLLPWVLLSSHKWAQRTK